MKAITVSYRVLDWSKDYPLRSPCPYCGAKLTMSINATEQQDDGTWAVTDMDIQCASEPDIDEPGGKWDNWSADHGQRDFCEAWHDLHERLVRNLKRFCRVAEPSAANRLFGPPVEKASK